MNDYNRSLLNFFMIQFLVVNSFLVLLSVGLLLPSDGNHGVLAPKSLTFLISAFLLGIYFISKMHLLKSQAWAFIGILSAVVFFGVWYLIGINQSPLIASGQFDQFKVFMTTLYVPFAAYYLIKENLITPQKILRTAIFANFVYCSIKISLMGLHLIGAINVWSVMYETGFRFMSMNILGEVGRIQTSVDIATPYLVFFVLQNKILHLKLSKKFIFIYLIIAALSDFLSFSRLLIFAYGLSVVLHGMTLPFKNQIKMWIALFVISILSVIAIGPEKVERVVEKRLFSNDNYQSDLTRQDQIDAMMKECNTSPYFGNGLGGYTIECVRDYALPHAYEVQWVAFLMQFGLIGILIILLPLLFLSFYLLMPSFHRANWCYFVLFLLWLSSGFTNPFLISLTSGILYMLFILGGDILHSNEDHAIESNYRISP